MRLLSSIVWLIVGSSLAACTNVRVGGEIQPGRYALRRGEPKEALRHFQRAAQIDPDYLTRFTPLNQGVWTYIGRAHYELGNLPQATEALQRADALHGSDHMADLYLGLAQARQGNYAAASQELEQGLSGLGNWLEYMDAYHPSGFYWDPGRLIREDIQRTLKLLHAERVNWPQIIARAEYIGDQMEDEIEDAPRRERRDRRDDGRDNTRKGL